jgi:hypothetical protein
LVPSDHLLFETENGRVYHGVYFGRVVLTFKEYWMVWDRDGFVRFRNQVVRLAICPLGRRFLADRGIRLVDEAGAKSLVLSGAEAEELVWLLDSAHYMLYAETQGIGIKDGVGMACATKVEA